MTQISPLFAHMNLDGIVRNDSEFLQKVEKEFSNISNVQSVFSNLQNSSAITIGNDQFYVVHYKKEYTLGQRIGRFFQGLALTIGTGFIGLCDQRVRTNWSAAIFGNAQKHLAVSKNISSTSLAKFAIHSFVSDPIGALNHGKTLITNLVQSMSQTSKDGLEKTLRSFFHIGS